MSACYVTIRDIQTRFNPIFHTLKIAHIQREIEELYHSGTTVTSYHYDIGVLSVSSQSAEDVAISLMGKREHLDKLMARHERYIDIHQQALDKISKGRVEDVVSYFQSGVYSYAEVGAVFSLSGSRVGMMITEYRQAISDMMTNDDMDDSPISDEEVAQLSAVIEENVMYEPVATDKTLDPLHGLSEWNSNDTKRRNELRRKRKAEISAV